MVRQRRELRLTARMATAGLADIILIRPATNPDRQLLRPELRIQHPVIWYYPRSAKAVCPFMLAACQNGYPVAFEMYANRFTD